MRMACLADEAVSFDFGGRFESPAIPVRTDVPPAQSRFESPRFETMALLAGKLPARAGDLLGLLLPSAAAMNDRGCEVLRPLWAEEAMHRAYGFVRLVDARNRRRVSSDESSIARDLAVRFRVLEFGDERQELPSSAMLRDVVTGLGLLFGCPGNITLKTSVEPISLQAYKRRALVLAAAELVNNALLHAFKGRKAGMITVALTAHGAESACLRVADNGTGFADSSPNLACGVAAGFAGLLEADLTYDRVAGWTIAEIAFPI